MSRLFLQHHAAILRTNLIISSIQASFVFPDGPGTSTIARLMRVNFFAKTKTNIGNLPLSRWKTIELLKKSKILKLKLYQ